MTDTATTAFANPDPTAVGLVTFPTAEDLTPTSVATVAPDSIRIPINATAPATISVDASGVPHMVIPLTKSTKAHVGTTIAGITTAGELALTFIDPSNTTEATIIKIVVAVAGLVGTWLGINLTTNLPKTVK